MLLWRSLRAFVLVDLFEGGLNRTGDDTDDHQEICHNSLRKLEYANKYNTREGVCKDDFAIFACEWRRRGGGRQISTLL